jgi:small-conductance mechanosensitive channel
LTEEFDALRQVNYFSFGLAFGGSLLIGILLEVINRIVGRLLHQRKWLLRGIVFHAFRWQFLLWSVLLSIIIPLSILQPDAVVREQLWDFAVAVIGVSLTIVVARIFTGWIKASLSERETVSVSILENMINATGVFFVVGMAMFIIGFPVAPILAAIGGSSVGLAFAFRETLSNLFSGILLTASNRIKPGDYVRLASGEEGYVVDIEWHTTSIRQLANNLIVVPNAIMTGAVMVNYDRPEAELSILVDVGVSYDSDLDHVERVTCDVADDVMQEVTGGVASAPSFIRYNLFGDFAINFTVIMRGKTFVDQYLIKHEFVKRLHERYRKEGIVIPFPIRTLHTEPANPVMVSGNGNGNGRGVMSDA